MDMFESDTPRSSMKQARELVKDLHGPIVWIYWTDFLLSILVGHACFAGNVHSSRWLIGHNGFVWSVKGLLFVVTVLLFLRSAMFTHELVHLPREGWRAFRVVWNILCGFPFLIPSFTYYPHIDHHRRKSYGTNADGEYLNLSHRPPSAIVLYMLGAFVAPLLGLIRFGILSPIAWVFPMFRSWTFRHASTMVMDITYERPEGNRKVRQIMLLQEACCFVVCLYIALHGPLIAKTWFDPLWLHAYCVGVAIVMLNNVRTLGSHRWTGDGSELSVELQILDSCDYPKRPWITELWGPTGTRYHATHHMFPSVPYHNLGIAHRRFMSQLPADNIFRQTSKKSLMSEIVKLWKRSATASKRRKHSQCETCVN